VRFKGLSGLSRLSVLRSGLDASVKNLSLSGCIPLLTPVPTPPFEVPLAVTIVVVFVFALSAASSIHY
jgi:hypothetical protein